MNSYISRPILRHSWIFTLLGFIALVLNGCNPAEMKTAAAQVPQLTYSIASEPKTFNVVLTEQ
ncbi:hypothetical protein [Scytonema sp. UIC 10036]|uniref:hypothetical protein n=1 Tax=Scytonema sp. UIC 10036 TaxID=2304196 RepID=UPI001A9BEF72|nr:hypothetical protein [Scytonema sp. UIC 10036]